MPTSNGTRNRSTDARLSFRTGQVPARADVFAADRAYLRASGTQEADLSVTQGVDPKALKEFKRMMAWIAVAAVVMVIGALWYLSLFGPLYLSMVLATIGGVFISTILGCGLFAAAFFSDKSGHDQSVTDAGKAEREHS